MKKYINIIVGGVAAGAMIAVAAALYLKVDGFYGAIMFSIGLLTILWYGFNLYTGKVGQLFVNRNPLQLLIILISNLIGCCAIFVFNVEDAAQVISNRFNTPFYLVFGLAIVCGVCIEAAVEQFKMGRWYIVPFYVAAFILCGARHCIAEFCYMLAARQLHLQQLGYLIIVILGNSIGSILLYTWKEKIK